MNKPTPAEYLAPMTLAQKIEALLKAHQNTNGKGWQRGISTHHTRTECGYHIAEFHHAVDAEFCDMAHALVPELMAHLVAMQHAQTMRQYAESSNTALRAEASELRAFAKSIVNALDSGDLGRDQLKSIAAKHGLLVETMLHSSS
jgi:formate-dependent nitrite reductase cytochrome c552 subunit